MAARVGSLFTELTVDASGLVTGLGRAGTRLESFERGANTRLGKLDRGFSSTFANIGRSASSMVLSIGAGLGGALAGIGGAAVFSTLKDTARAIADIGDKARQAGMDVVSFQELGAVARANRLEVDDLSAAMRELQLRSDEWISSAGKSGSAAEAFARIGYTVDELKGKLADPSALLSEIIGKVQTLDRAAQIRIFDELFGGDGERLIRLLDDGEAGVKRIIEQARLGGQIFDEQLVDRASELDRAIAGAAATVGNQLQGAIVNAGWQLYNFIQQFQAFEQRTNQSLDQSMRDLGLERLAATNAIMEIEKEQREAGGTNAMIFESRIADERARLERILEDEKGILAVLESRKPPTIAAPTMDMPGAGAGWDEFSGTFGVPAAGGSGGRSGATEGTVAQTDATTALIAKLREELAAVGANAVQQRIANELRAAGVDLMSSEGQEIARLVSNIASQEDAYAGLQQAISTASSLTKDFVGGLLDDVRNGVPAVEALGNAFGRLGDRLIDMALDQAINSLFANLLGGFGGAGGVGDNVNQLQVAMP
ncbi:MAG TPA: hypothetical protein VGN60_02795 [Devosia sp.]|jgi:hypothetical protein|nr:hypothetical protein [Devosia sp.]